MATELETLAGEIAARSQELDALFKKRDADGRQDWTDADRDRFKELNAELDDKTPKYEKLFEAEREVREAKARNDRRLEMLDEPAREVPYGTKGGRVSRGGLGFGRDDHERPAIKSIGELFVESREFKGFRDGGMPKSGTSLELPDRQFGLQLKTLMTGAAGFAPARDRGADVVPYAVRGLTLLDFIPEVGTNADAIVYMEETTRTANAAPVAEGASKPESARAYTQRTVLVEVIATTLPVTEQQLADVPQLRGILDVSLSQEVRLAEEDQILTGNGTSPQLKGFLTTSGVQTQAKNADPVPSAIYRAMTLVRFTGYAEPTAVVLHPNDWQDIRLLQDSTGRYIWGDPSEAGPERIWGKPVVQTTAETENTGLVGDFGMYSYVARRMGVRIDVGFVNDQFIKNQRTLRAESRLALVIRRPSAFCKVTGI